MNTPAANSTYPKGGVSCSKDSFVVNQTLVFKIKFCGKSPALRVAANRYAKLFGDLSNNSLCNFKQVKKMKKIYQSVVMLLITMVREELGGDFAEII